MQTQSCYGRNHALPLCCTPKPMKLLSGRQLRSVKVTSVRWQRRALFLMGGVAGGAVAVALAYLADWAQEALALLLARSRYASLVVTPLGYALSVFITRHYIQNSQGSV